MNLLSVKILTGFLVFSALLIGLRAEDPAFFPLMAWNWTPAEPAVLKKMRECGLTLAGFVSPDALDACQAAGLKAIVSDARTSGYDWKNLNESVARTNIASLVAAVGKHPALYGFYLIDEPHSSLYPGLGKVTALVREMAPGKWAYVNLFPNYATTEQLGERTYEDYVAKFIATCRPAILSYDHYAVMEDGSLREEYWLNLEQMRAAALKNGLPFWNIVLTVGCLNYREVTSADLRFQVYTTLAYGGGGISYFTYFTPSVGNFRMAPIDQFGNQTITWDHLRQVNLQVEKLAPTLLKLKSDDVYHFGALPPGCHRPNETNLVKEARSAEFMAGDFTHQDGSRYVLVVNKDLARSRYCALQFRTSPKRVQMVSPYSGQLIDFSGEQKWLAPGQGALLKVE